MKHAILLCWIAAFTLCLNAPAFAKTQVLVFPFEPENNVPRWEWLGQGLAADVELRLLRISSVDVTRHSEYVPREQTLGVAKGLGVDSFVRGTYRIVGEFVQIRADVVNVATPDMPKAFSGRALVSNPLKALNDLCTSLPVSTGTRLLRSEYGVLETPSTRDAKAFETYVKGLVKATTHESDSVKASDSLALAVVFFRKAADQDPRFFGPYYQLGWIHELSSDPDRAVAAYRKALKRMPGIQRIQDAIDRLTDQGVSPL